MPSITGVSGGTLASVVQAQARASSPASSGASTASAASAGNTQDTVTLSAEAQAKLAGGKPFFAAAGAEGAATADAAAVGKSEAKRKHMLSGKLDDREDAIQGRQGKRLERMKKMQVALQDRVGGRVKSESAQKDDRGTSQSERLGKQEEAVKSRAGDRRSLMLEKSKKQGRPVDEQRLDRLGDRVKTEEAQKAGRLEGADERRLVTEKAVKARGADRLKASGGRTEAQTKRLGDRTELQLGKVEARRKRLVRSDAGGEQKIKAQAVSPGATTGSPEAQQAADAKTDVI